MATKTLPTTSVENIPVGSLSVDKAYQRMVRPLQVKTIVENFNESAFGTLIVGRRDSGKTFVVDGQQRLLAAKKLGIQNVLCAVFESGGRADEASVFKMINKDRTGIPAQIVYKACLWAGDPETLALDAVVRECGFSVPHGKSTSWPNITAASSLYKIFRMKDGRQILVDTLMTIRDSWKKQDFALQSVVLLGLSRFIYVAGDAFDIDRLIGRLSKCKPEHLVSDADAARKLIGGGRHKVVALAVAKLYNKGLRSSSRIDIARI